MLLTHLIFRRPVAVFVGLLRTGCERHIERIQAVLGGATTVSPVPVPADCVDGFTEAFYNRPERFLDPSVRGCQSAWGFVDPVTADRGLARLRSDLESGAWDERYGEPRRQPTFVGALRLITALPAGIARVDLGG
ncbi:hypothetical protein FrEUN1fDRAFT_5206 [Parafrankia sp. EUN1f]|nr:hypothetical protein FrEUN1fDRAFT_5206 [Parafrankia sp. EUN1f]